LKKFCFIIVLAQFAFFSNAQQYNYSKFWVSFKNKNNSPYTVSNPSEFLSQRAIERRQRYNIAIDEKDLPVNPDYVSFLEGKGTVVLTRSKWMNAVTIEVSDTSILDTLRQFSFVKSIEPVFGTKIQHSSEVETSTAVVRINASDPYAEYGSSLKQIALSKGHYLHHNNYLGQDMVIAVLDAGFRKVDIIEAFQHLYTQGRLLGARDFVNGNITVTQDSADGHGTNVLSTMAGYLPGQFIGSAPKASYWLLRCEDSPTEFRIEEDNWIAAAEFADSVGADIINSSLGYSDFDDTAMNYTYADMNGKTARISQGATIAARKGMIVVNSAGNSGNNPWRYITAPADADSILAVGAVDSNGVAAKFSSRGPASDGRVKPDVMAQGFQTVVISTSGQVGKGNGTSFASPVMAGLTACFWQAHREKNNIEIINLIREHSSLFSAPNDSMGYGIPDFRILHNKLQREKSLLYRQENLPVVFPNPFYNNLEVMLYAYSGDDYEVMLFDYMGKQLYYEKRFIETGFFSDFKITGLSGLNSGIYFIRIRSIDINETIRVAKY
jgi:serine protease AprX